MGHCTLPLATEEQTSVDLRSAWKETGAGEEGSLQQVPRASPLQHPNTEHQARSSWTEPSDEHSTQYGLFTGYTEDQGMKRMICHKKIRKALQFQLHKCKPSTRIELARCFLIIIHFPLLTLLNKYNLPNQILTISPF